MPQQITLYRIFVSAPSDVVAEQTIVEELLTDWNRQHGVRLLARVELVDWRTGTHPATGNRPQAIINKQAFDPADIVVAIFRGRIGTPTGKAESGTVEEIERGIRKKKPVMVYFGPGAKGRGSQIAQIEKFKKRLGKKALYHVFTDNVSFEKAFRQHLASVMNDVLRKQSRRIR